MWLEEYRWHYDYVRLAWDTGFSFGRVNKPNFDKNKLILIDVEHIIRERDIASVERYIPTIITYNLENEQAAVLDCNFVKVFRLSQLAVEYLLFCKKYLDNTVVLLKKDISKLNQEMQELKKYNEELETHISVLSKHNLIGTFKCDKCSKIFSTEDYLNSHIRRRHSEESTQVTTDSETAKLHSEIKQLKERLNTTEKLLQDKTTFESEQSQKKIDQDIVEDIQEKFNNFKEQVENEIANLQIQKTFYEEKYGKMFDLVFQSKNNITENSKSLVLKNNEKNEISTQTLNPPEEKKLENCTQTEETKKQMNFETVQNIDLKGNENDNSSETHDYIDDKIEQKINDFGETIDSKISLGLENIEKHMQIFWEKLNLMETTKNNQLVPEVKTVIPLSESTEKSEAVKSDAVPVVKPRTKFSQPTTLPDKKESLKKAEKIQNELNKILVQSRKKSLKSLDNKSEDNSSDSDSQEVHKKHKDIEIAEKSSTSIVRSSRTLLENVSSILELRLDSSEFIDTKPITEDTLKSALDIINRHDNAKKKVLSNRASPIKVNRHMKKSRNTINRKEGKSNVIKIRYQKRTKEDKSEVGSSVQELVSIKNRSLYDSDSENDMKKYEKPYADKTQRAVIEELKNIHAITISQHQDDTDSDLTSVLLSVDERADTKGALKSSQLESSLVKKKVLFDVEDKENDKTKTNVNLEKKYEDNLSDFNYSDV